MKILFAFALIAAATPAAAEVVSAAPHGFQVRQVVNLTVAPEVAFASFGNVAGWWDDAHTYSGKAANMSMSMTPGGCFCEKLPDGGIEHMQIVYVAPNERLVLTGSLGPLLYEATSGVMDVQVKPRAGGSQLILDYRAAGFFNGGADKLAPVVDGVLAQQMKRFRAYAAARPRT